jgi:hypothetical protein
MTGGIPALLFLIVERIRGKNLPLRAFLLFLAFGFLAAAYQAHTQLSNELKSVRLMNDGLKADLKSAADQLTEARRQLADALKWRPSTPSVPLVQNEPIQPAVKILRGGKNALINRMRIYNGKGTAIETDAPNTKINETDVVR